VVSLDGHLSINGSFSSINASLSSINDNTLTFFAITGSIADILLATIFLVAACVKMLSLEAFRETLISLGIGRRVSRPISWVVPALELGTGTSLLAFADNVLPRFVGVSLAASFAIAGGSAGLSGRRIRCNCLGALGKSYLGWHQVFQFPGFLLLIITAQIAPPKWSVTSGLLILAVVFAGLILWQLRRERSLWKELQGDRMQVVLPCSPKSSAVLVSVGSEVPKEVVG
jgi:hypothetical protein